MSLLDDFKTLLNDKNEGATPDDVDIDDAFLVSDEYIESRRWYESWVAVFQRGDEYVALQYQVPATEMQEGGDFYSEVYTVRPVEVTVTKYEKF